MASQYTVTNTLKGYLATDLQSSKVSDITGINRQYADTITAPATGGTPVNLFTVGTEEGAKFADFSYARIQNLSTTATLHVGLVTGSTIAQIELPAGRVFEIHTKNMFVNDSAATFGTVGAITAVKAISSTASAIEVAVHVLATS